MENPIQTYNPYAGAAIGVAGQVGSSIAGLIGQAINNTRQNKIMMLQRNWALQDRRYNEPKYQMQRYIEAGLNPDLLTGQVNNSPPQTVPPSPHYQEMPNINLDVLGSFYQAKQIDLLNQQISESRSREDLNKSKTSWNGVREALDVMKKEGYENYDFWAHYIEGIVLDNIGQDLKNIHDTDQINYLRNMYGLWFDEAALNNANLTADLFVKSSVYDVNKSVVELNAQKGKYYNHLIAKLDAEVNKIAHEIGLIDANKLTVDEKLRQLRMSRDENHMMKILQCEKLEKEIINLKTNAEKNESRTELNNTLRQMKYVETLLDVISTASSAGTASGPVKSIIKSKSPSGLNETIDYEY